MLNNKELIEIKDGIISYDKIKNQKNVTFIIITQDMKSLEKTIKEITKIKAEHKDTDFTVLISSSYDKLLTLTSGKL